MFTRKQKFAIWPKTRLIVLFPVFIFLAAPATAGLFDRPFGKSTVPTEAVVKYVIDGDTIVTENGEKVRYLGIDAPETGHGGDLPDCHGLKSKEANTELVLGKAVGLAYGHETRDRYGRLLAWVFLPGGVNVNLEMVRSGNAWVYLSHGNVNSRMFRKLVAAQREAIQDRRGLWGACPAESLPVYFGNPRTHIFHRPDCPLGKEISPRHVTRFADRLSAFRQGYSPCRKCGP